MAHLIGDFLLQPNKWVNEKIEKAYKAPSLYLHTALHALLAYVIVGQWHLWQIPVLVFILHTLIDIWKCTKARITFYFIADQLLHLSSLVLITVIINPETVTTAWNYINSPSVLLFIIAYILVLKPFALIIDLFTAQWRKEIRNIEEKDKIGSLKNAGKYIGMLERFLVLTFMLSGNPSAIGMLIAAKSILRFNDLKGESSRKMSEYVLIGTLLSFSLCIITGLIVHSLLKFL